MDFNNVLRKLQEAQSKTVVLKKDYKGFPKGSKGRILDDYKGQGRYEVAFPIEGNELKGSKKLIFVGSDIEEYLEMK